MRTYHVYLYARAPYDTGAMWEMGQTTVEARNKTEAKRMAYTQLWPAWQHRLPEGEYVPFYEVEHILK